MSIQVTVGVLELEGVSPADRFRVSAAFERELAAIVAVRGLPEVPSLLPVAPWSSPEALGRSIARSTWAALPAGPR